MGLVGNVFMGATTKFVKMEAGGESDISDLRKLQPGDMVTTKSDLKPNHNRFERTPKVTAES